MDSTSGDRIRVQHGVPSCHRWDVYALATLPVVSVYLCRVDAGTFRVQPGEDEMVRIEIRFESDETSTTLAIEMVKSPDAKERELELAEAYYDFVSSFSKLVHQQAHEAVGEVAPPIIEYGEED